MCNISKSLLWVCISNVQLEDTDLESLPGQGAPVEVHEDISQALHVVPARLLDSQVRVDRGISEEEDAHHCCLNDCLRKKLLPSSDDKTLQKQANLICPALVHFSVLHTNNQFSNI